MVAALIAYFPPGSFTWRNFILDPASGWTKLVFLGKVYLVPAVLSFIAIVAFRVQMGIAMTGVASGSVFPLALVASGAMMAVPPDRHDVQVDCRSQKKLNLLRGVACHVSRRL